MTLNSAAIPTVALAELLFVTGIVLERKLQSSFARTGVLALGVITAIPCVLVLIDYTHLVATPAWFYEFRTARYSELTIAGLGFLTGYVYSLIGPEGTGEKAIWPIALLALVSIPFIKPVLDPIDLDSLRSICPDNVCLQSTYSTCGPSSAASILLSLGQSASEQSLAREALTSKGGTELWYLARALRKRGLNTEYVVDPSLPRSLPTPAVAGVVLGGGAGHFIALVSRNGAQLTVVDPLKGRFILRDDELGQMYHFTGVFLLVRRAT